MKRIFTIIIKYFKKQFVVKGIVFFYEEVRQLAGGDGNSDIGKQLRLKANKLVRKKKAMVKRKKLWMRF